MPVPTEPRNIAALPRDHTGKPVPWFAAWLDGVPDFRVVGPGKTADAVRLGLCWVCGGPAGSYKAFVAGPRCGSNRNSAEPPAHRDCAVYSAQACPFLAVPHMRRRENNLPEGARDPAGIAIKRNPGITLVWITKSYRVERTPDGPLFAFGDPVEVLWYAHGRPATRAEVEESIRTGMPLLRVEAERDGPGAVAELEEMAADFTPLLPAA